MAMKIKVPVRYFTSKGIFFSKTVKVSVKVTTKAR